MSKIRQYVFTLRLRHSRRLLKDLSGRFKFQDASEFRELIITQL